MSNQPEVTNHDGQQEEKVEGNGQAQEEVRRQALVGVIADIVMVATTTQKAATEPETQHALSVLQQLTGQLIDLALGAEWAKENSKAVEEALDARLAALRANLSKDTVLSGAQAGRPN